MIGYVVGGSIATLFGSNIINSIVSNTINFVCGSVSFIIGGSESSKHINDINLKLKSLDIDIKIDMVNVICSKIKHDEISLMCEANVEELIRRIEYLRDFIKKEVEEYNEKWLHSYRVLNLDIEIKELTSLVFVLDGRISLLMSLLK